MDDIAESKFNEGLAKLARIGYQRSLIMQYRPKHKWSKIFDCLINIRTEIWERMNQEERNECKNIERNLENQFLEQSKKGISVSMIMDYEDRLQDLAYKYKMSMPDRDKASMALR